MFIMILMMMAEVGEAVPVRINREPFYIAAGRTQT
jgi:hypothetical protein